MNEKKVFLDGEADAYFYRNKNAIIANGEISTGTKMSAEFFRKSNICSGGGADIRGWGLLWI